MCLLTALLMSLQAKATAWVKKKKRKLPPCRMVWIAEIHSIYSPGVNAALTTSLMGRLCLFLHSKSGKKPRKVLSPPPTEQLHRHQCKLSLIQGWIILNKYCTVLSSFCTNTQNQLKIHGNAHYLSLWGLKRFY